MDIFDLSTTTKIDGHDYLAAATQLIESLTNGWHVTGTFEGSTAAISMDPAARHAKLFLPALLKGALTRTQCDIYTGAILHELLHVLYTTGDFMEVMHTQHGVLGASLLNCIEDCRIERRGDDLGVATNLIPLLSRLRKHTYARGVAENGPVVDSDIRNLPYAIKMRLNAVIGIDTGAVLNLPKFEPYFAVAVAEFNRPTFAASGTAGAYALACTVMAMLADGQSDDGQSDDGQSDDGQSDDDGRHFSGDDTIAGVVPDTTEATTSEFQARTDAAAEGTLVQAIQHLGRATKKRAVPCEYPADKVVTDMARKTKRLENGLRNALVSTARTGTVTRRTRGRLNGHDIARVKTRELDVFKRRWDTPAHSTAVALVFDHSSSMDHAPLTSSAGDRGPSRRAMALALELVAGRTLRKAQVPFSIIRYTSNVYVTKTIHDRYSAAQLSRNVRGQEVTGMTNTSLAIVEAAATLEAADATRKMLLVITDGGCNYGAAAVQEACNYVRARGIDQVNCLALDDIGGFAGYDHAVGITAESLPREGLKMLSQ